MTLPPRSTSKTVLARRLGEVRRRVVAIGGVAGLGWGICCAVGIVAVLVWLDLIWDLPPEARVASWCVVIPMALAVPAFWFGRAWRCADNSNLAARLDAAGGTPGTIAAGWHLALGKKPLPSELSAGLAAIAIARAEHDVSGISPARVAPLTTARPAVVAACITVAAMACFVVMAPELAATEWRRFLHPFEETAPYSPVTIVVEPGDTRVAYGAGLDVRVQIDGALAERVNLVLRSENGSEELLPMFADGSGDYRTTLASITAPARYGVRADSARSRMYRIDVTTVPKLEKLHVRIDPPEYTRMAPYEGSLPPDGIAGLVGTRVTMQATSNRPLAGGSVRIAGKDGTEAETVALAALASGSDTVAGSFTIARPGTFELRVTDVAGETSIDTYAGAIVVTEDERPFVRLMRPQQTSLAVPTAVVPVQWAAEDDYGVSRVTLFRSLNASQWLPHDLPSTVPPERRVSGAIDLPLSAYGLEPGDEISLFVRAEDNDPAGAKGAESSIARIRIISQAEFDAMIERQYTLDMLASKYRQVKRRLAKLAAMNKRLAEAVAKKPGEEGVDQEDREALEALKQRLAKDIAELEAVAAIKLPFDLDQALAEELDKHIARLADAARELGEATGKPGLTGDELAEALAALAAQLAEAEQQGVAAMMPPIEHLEAIMPLLAAEAEFIELARLQRDLAERIHALVGEENPQAPAVKARARELAAEQADVRTRLDTLLAEIEGRADLLPDDPALDNLRETARRFAQDVRDTFVLDDMLEAESALAKPEPPRAAVAAKTAADKLEAFVKKCEAGLAMQGQGCDCLGFAPSLAKPMQGTIAQLLARLGSGGAGAGMTGRGQTGMYGHLPVALGLLGGHGESDDVADTIGGSSAAGGPDGPATITALGPSTSAPTTRHEPPAAYRRRVADYFRRLAEDLEESP